MRYLRRRPVVLVFILLMLMLLFAALMRRSAPPWGAHEPVAKPGDLPGSARAETPSQRGSGKRKVEEPTAPLSPDVPVRMWMVPRGL